MPGLAGEVANLIVALKLDDSGFSGRLNAAARQLKGFDRGLSQIGRGVGQIGTGLDKLATRGAVAAVGGLTAVITTAASMEQAFTGVEKTVDASDAQLEELRQTIRKMSSDTGVAFEELARIGEAGGALGIPTDDLDEFIDVVSRLGVSTNLSVDQAATSLGHLATILDLSGEEMVATADALVALGNSGASTEDQIVAMAERFAAAGSQAGLSTDEILALSSAVASMGVEVEAGGSSLSRLFNQTTTNIGVANDKAQAFADALGLTFDEFKKAWDTDALGTFQDLLAHLNELDQFEGAALLADLGITNVRDINAIQLMAQNFEDVDAALRTAADSQGALNRESDKFFSTGAAGFRRLWQNLRLTADTIGTELLPITNDLISQFVTWLQLPEQQTALKDFATDLAEGIRGFVDEMKGTDFSGILGGFRLTAEVAKGAFDAFKALPAPLQQLAIAALVANKVTGGAIGDIAKGIANIFGGALRTIFATHVTVVGGTVTGGGLGGPGGVGPGGAGRLGSLAVGAVGTAGALLTLEGGFEKIDDLTTAIEQQDIAGALNEINFSPGALIADALDEPIGQLVDAITGASKTPSGFTGQITGAPGRGGTPSVPGGFAGQVSGAPGGGGDPKARAALQRIATEVATLPDTAMAQSQTARIVGQLQPLVGRADAQLAQARANLSATYGVSGAVRGVQSTIAAKDFSFNPTLIVPVQVNFSTTMYQTTVARQVASRTGGGDATTGGI